MNAKDLKLLERVFEAEISSAINGGPYVAQIKSKRMLDLEKEGYVQRHTEVLGGRFPLKISGWILTELGRVTYCMSC